MTTLRFYLAHETKDGQPVIGLAGWTMAFVERFAALAGGCTLYEARGAYVHPSGVVQFEPVTVFEASYDAAAAQPGEVSAFVELLKRYGREAQQSEVRTEHDGRAVRWTERDFGPLPASYREEWAEDVFAGKSAGVDGGYRNRMPLTPAEVAENRRALREMRTQLYSADAQVEFDPSEDANA